MSIRVECTVELLKYMEYVKGALPENVLNRCFFKTCPFLFGVEMMANPFSDGWSSRTLDEGACLLEAIREAFQLDTNQYFQSALSLAHVRKKVSVWLCEEPLVWVSLVFISCHFMHNQAMQ